MLDTEILTAMMRSAGLGPARIEAALPAAMDAAQDAYGPNVPDLRNKTCPAVPEVLRNLRDSGAVLALVTGNLPRIGWRKLERAGLDRFFRFGAFAGMAATRGELARLAIERARSENLIGPEASISLVGDAPQDILAAKQNGIRSIAVRTGITPPGDLESCAPDYLLDDLTGFDPASVLGSGHRLK
jgi:phosphoglycolate phosphatase-like HAD superfamily hydrolase